MGWPAGSRTFDHIENKAVECLTAHPHQEWSTIPRLKHLRQK
jgi:hypothetical protein